MNPTLRAREDDEVKILEGLNAFIVALHDDEVIVETEDGRPKWIKIAHLEPVETRGQKDRNVWRELPKTAA
jgi:hypothetical protein